MNYDFDVLVIGAGPAGLAAAIRLRWVKGYQPIPCSTALIDPETPGGLAAIGGCVLTGPSWSEGAEGIVDKLLLDQKRLNIPHIRARALSVKKQGQLFHTQLSDGQILTSLAIVVATGFRALDGEARLFGRGLFLTYKGYAFFPSLLAQAAKFADGRGLVIVGNRRTLDLLPLLTPHIKQAGKITLLLQKPPDTKDRPLMNGVEIQQGQVLSLEGDSHLEALVIQKDVSSDLGKRKTIQRLKCGAAFIDYYAYECQPEQWDNHSLKRDNRGFITVDSAMGTSQDGLFAAGDVTGRYASTSMALGDGVCAGFSALRFVHQKKFACDANLFAYAPTGPNPGEFSDPELARRPFPLPAKGKIFPLAPQETLNKALNTLCLKDLTDPAPSIKQVAEYWDLSPAETDKILFELMYRRLISIHHVPKERHLDHVAP